MNKHGVKATQLNSYIKPFITQIILIHLVPEDYTENSKVNDFHIF